MLAVWPPLVSPPSFFVWRLCHKSTSQCLRVNVTEMEMAREKGRGGEVRFDLEDEFAELFLSSVYVRRIPQYEVPQRLIFP